MLRESGKNTFAIMRFLENRLTGVEGDYTSYGNRGRYSIVELKKKLSNDRKRLLVHRDMNIFEDDTKEGKETTKEGSGSDEEADSEGEFQLDSDDDEEEEGIGNTSMVKSELDDLKASKSEEDVKVEEPSKI